MRKLRRVNELWMWGCAVLLGLTFLLADELGEQQDELERLDLVVKVCSAVSEGPTEFAACLKEAVER